LLLDPQESLEVSSRLSTLAELLPVAVGLLSPLGAPPLAPLGPPDEAAGPSLPVVVSIGGSAGGLVDPPQPSSSATTSSSPSSSKMRVVVLPLQLVSVR
jgi:hypothetical protein